MLFLILAVVNQGLWLSWAILVPEIGTMIFATVTGIITVSNLICGRCVRSGRDPSCRRLFRSATTSHRSTAKARQ